MANKESWNQRVLRLRNTLAVLDNTSDLISGQRYLRKALKTFLGSEGAKTVAAIEQLGNFPELDDLEKAVRRAIQIKPVEGLGSLWETPADEEEEQQPDQQEQQEDSQEEDESDESEEDQDQDQEDEDPERRKKKRKEKEKEKKDNKKQDPEKNREPTKEKTPEKPGQVEKPGKPGVRPGGPTPSGGGGAGATGGTSAAGGTAAAGGAAAGGAAAGGAAAGGAAAGGAAAGGTAAAGGAAAGGVAAVGWPVILVIVLIVAILLVALYVTRGGKNKIFSSAGGGQMVAANYDDPEQREAVEKVKALIAPADGKPVVVIREPAKADDLIGWVGEGEKKKSKTDYRLLKTIGYLADQSWSKIVIGITSSNGPDVTRRQGKPNATDAKVDASSAYASGQAIGIVALGETSPGLTSCLGLSAPIPVEIAWQETAIETVLRPLHEKLQVNAGSAAGSLVSPESPAPVVLRGDGKEFAVKTQSNLRELVTALESNRSTNPAALKYAKEALADMDTALADGSKGSYPIMRRALEKTFRTLQVANMQGWEGSTDNKCRLWKAYEARQNQRKLVLQIMQMPVVLKTETAAFNPEFVVKQVIVFSPEDDLDNGIPDTDIFPIGAIGVDVGGVGYDDTTKDGRITEADTHFLALPQDNGILSKASTVFAKKTEEDVVEESEEESEEARKQFDTALDFGYESEGRVSYKNFVHIGF